MKDVIESALLFIMVEILIDVKKCLLLGLNPAIRFWNLQGAFFTAFEIITEVIDFYDNFLH